MYCFVAQRGVWLCFLIRYFTRALTRRGKRRARGRVVSKKSRITKKGRCFVLNRADGSFPNAHDRVSIITPKAGCQELGELHTTARLEMSLPSSCDVDSISQFYLVK